MQLDKFNNQNEDIFNFFLSYFESRLDNPSIDRSDQKMLKLRNKPKVEDDARILSGIIETGEYGYEAELYNIGKDKVTYRRQTDDAELLPFYFLFYLPKNVSKGIVILQRFQQFGMKEILKKDLEQIFKSGNPNYIISINPLVPEKLIEEFMKGKVKKIRFIRYGFPDDIADAYDNFDNNENPGMTELVIKAKRGHALPFIDKIKELIEKNQDPKHLIEIHNFDYDDIKVEIDLNGNKRTIHLAELGNIRPYYDISDKIVKDKDGHPTFESIDSVAYDLFDDIKSDLLRDLVC